MNIPEVANELLESAKLRMSIAAGGPCGIVIHVIKLTDQGQMEGVFTAATFAPNSQNITPLIQSLINAAVQAGAPINGSH